VVRVSEPLLDGDGPSGSGPAFPVAEALIEAGCCRAACDTSRQLTVATLLGRLACLTRRATIRRPRRSDLDGRHHRRGFAARGPGHLPRCRRRGCHRAVAPPPMAELTDPPSNVRDSHGLRYDTISFLTDYGQDDEFVGVVKSVI
jgi:hypothetical protein